ncbi:MAG TPA: acetate--CoA ligase family protein, partial [Vicinamibacterales bacterium]|nr:acetate--CoA ligase family protein [Vicinamibacterales bacterium]
GRLAEIALARGIDTFEADVLPSNARMIDVFESFGFVVQDRLDNGTLRFALSLTPTDSLEDKLAKRARLAASASMKRFFTPASVAVVGAGRKPGTIGAEILRNLKDTGYTGKLVAINPNASEIGGVPSYTRIGDVPFPVDLAVVVVPAEHVPGVVDEALEKGVKALVVITAGFGETGEEGRRVEARILEKVRAAGARMIGPNCMGILNMDPAVQMNASFSPVRPPAGAIALSSQSGALGVAILRLAHERQIGLSSFVSVGNKADVSSNDLLEYWESDPRTRVILLYLESFGNPRRFARLARRIAREKPIVALKAGRSRAGSRAAGSHTAALAAKDTAVDALFRQAGVIRADTIDEMFDIAACLDAQPLPAGPRVAIVTNAGGPAILAVDACEAAGLRVVEFGPELRERLETFLPRNASVANPIDMIASAGADAYQRTIETVLDAADVDSLIVVFTPVDDANSEIVLAGIRAGISSARSRGVGKPIVACIMSNAGGLPLRVWNETIPTYAFPENAARALGKVTAFASWRAAPSGLFWTFDDLHVEEARNICRAALARGDTWLNDEDVWGVLTAFGFPVAIHKLARTSEEAALFASVIGFPVAAKLASTRVVHKTELGAVRLNLASADEVRAAFEHIVARAEAAVGKAGIDGVLIQPMINGGVETLLGITHDPLFGPLVAFGIGGTNVEAVNDVRFRVAPLTDRDADELLREIRGHALLTGHRGRTPADVPALRDVLLRMSCLAEQVPEIEELDLNPVIALAPGAGCRVIDARIKIAAHAGVSAADAVIAAPAGAA